MHAEHETERPGARRRWRWLLELALVAGVLFALHSYQTRNVAGGAAPAFDARLLDGTRVSLDDYRGRPLLLQFWATWCPVCRLEQGSIDAVARDHQVLAVSLDDMNAAGVQAWMADQGVAYPVAIDVSGELARRYGITGVPASLVIDGNGEIRFTEVGYTSEAGLRLRLWWAGR
jgi:peroxiredoxin